MKAAVYPGSFDPITNGHLDVIERGSKMFEKLIVVVLVNKDKKPMFSLEEKLDLISKSVAHLPNVYVDSFEGLLVNYMCNKKINIIVRGLRAMSDFENEFQMALMNKKLCNHVETIFLVTKLEYSYLSSSAVKELAMFDGEMEDLVPEYVHKKIINKVERGKR